MLLKKPDRTTSRPAGFSSAHRHQVIGHNPEKRTQFKDIPALLAENSHARPFAGHRITFAGNRFDERRLAASIRPQYRDVFVGMNAQIEVVEHYFVSAHHAQVPHLQQRAGILNARIHRTFINLQYSCNLSGLS